MTAENLETSAIAALAAALLALASGCGIVPEKLLPAADAPSAQASAKDAPASPAPAASSPQLTRPAIAEFDSEDANETGELRFQPGDTIRVAIWGHPELDHVAVVQPNGNITVPLVGEVRAAESTVARLRQRVEQGLAPYTRITTPDLRPGDVLHFQVWHEEGLRHGAVIEPNGYATFPLIGAIRAVGRPVEEIRKEAESRMLGSMRDARVSIMPVYSNRRVLQDFAVSVLSQQLQPRRIAVIGEVGVQGLSDLRNGMRVVEALAQHQVRQLTAQLNSIVLIRNPSVGAPRYRLVRIADFLEGKAPGENVVLRNGDIVIVPKTTIARVGDFVDLFFSRTLPIFSWWAGLWQAATASASADTVRLINESLQRQLTNITINPTP